MSVATLNNNELGDDTHIGAASHWRRNLIWFVGVAVVAGLIVAFYAYSGRTDAVEMGRLESFRAAFAQRCDAPEFAKPTPPMVKDLYLNSATVRSEVDHQLAALEGGASCETVSKALRAADYPMPVTPPPQ